MAVTPHAGAVTRDELFALVGPKNALVKQYQRFFGDDNIELVFTDDALWEIADKALERENRCTRPALDHRDRAARRDVRATVAP